MALIPQKLLLDLAVALELAFQISLVIRFLFFSVITVTEHRYLLSFQKSRQIQFLDFFSADRDYLSRWLMFGGRIAECLRLGQLCRHDSSVISGFLACLQIG